MSKRGEYPGPADKLATSSEWCQFRKLGRDFDGTHWSRCVVHGYDGLGAADDLNVYGLCEGYKAPAYIERKGATA